jgi:DNA-binding NarL/FixJ family response regulator
MTEDAAEPIRVLIADDHALFRSGLRAAIEGQHDLVCIGEVSNGRDAVAEILRLQPDVAFVDIRMPKLDGLAATRTICQSRCPTRILILTTYDDETTLQHALEAGASGFLLKTLPPEELIAAIKVAVRGDTLIDPSMMRRLAPLLVKGIAPTSLPVPPEVQQLTSRELDVLLLIAHALSNAEISEKLGIGEQTVKTHVSRILFKLGLRDRIQAAVYVYRHRLS